MAKTLAKTKDIYADLSKADHCWDVEQAIEIVDRYADGEYLKDICESEHLPSTRSVKRWRYFNIGGFADALLTVDTMLMEANERRSELIADNELPLDSENLGDEHIRFLRDKLRCNVLGKRNERLAGATKHVNPTQIAIIGLELFDFAEQARESYLKYVSNESQTNLIESHETSNPVQDHQGQCSPPTP